MDDFEVACGSVIGKDHVSNGKVLVGRNNQDAYAVRQTDDLLVAIVCDGCGSGKHSEVGAWLGANMIAEALAARATGRGEFLDIERVLERVRRDVLAVIRTQANLLGGSFSRAINDYFLFTIVGVIIKGSRAYVFSIGDGAYALRLAGCVCEGELVFGDQGVVFSRDGEFRHGLSEFCSLGPFPDNSPPYLAYDLVESSIDPVLLEFKIERILAIETLSAVVIGSDGLYGLEGAPEALIPGSKEKVGLFDQFWQDDSYFTNPEALSRRLRRMNSDVVRVDKATGRKITYPRLLADDTTLVAIRRRNRES